MTADFLELAKLHCLTSSVASWVSVAILLCIIVTCIVHLCVRDKTGPGTFLIIVSHVFVFVCVVPLSISVSLPSQSYLQNRFTHIPKCSCLCFGRCLVFVFMGVWLFAHMCGCLHPSQRLRSGRLWSRLCLVYHYRDKRPAVGGLLRASLFLGVPGPFQLIVGCQKAWWVFVSALQTVWEHSL